MGFWARLVWRVRRGLWNVIARAKFKGNRPLAILPMPSSWRPVEAVPLSQVYPDVSVPSLFAARRILCDEKRPWWQYLKKIVMFGLQRRLLRIFPPMQAGLPMIDADQDVALGQAYSSRHDRVAKAAARKAGVSREVVLDRPVCPVELTTVPDLGLLAVRGPYAPYLQRINGDLYEWDVTQLADPAIECHAGLYRPWAHVQFQRLAGSVSLRPMEIRTELGVARPGDTAWPLAVRLALSAVTTHTGLVRHWNWLHLMAGEALAIATRTAFSPAHPLARFLWPHIYGTQQSNRFGNQAQLVPQGDFAQTYSLTPEGLYAYLERSSREFLFEMGNPSADARRRGVADCGLDLPTQENGEALYRLMHRHAQRYVGVYYEEDAAVHRDHAVQAWIEQLHRLLPHAGIGALWPLSAAGLAELLGRIVYLASAYHESVGAQLWDYQLWSGLHPVRLYRDGRRDPLDVYQRLVNTNYLLQVIRAPLMADYSALALEEPTNPRRTEQARQVFRTFRDELATLQQAMEAGPREVWLLTPAMLEVNINA